MKWPRGKVDECFVPTLEDNAIEVRDIFADTKNGHVLKDCLYYDKKNSERLAIDDIPFIFKYDLKTDCGGLDFNITRRRENVPRLEVCGGLSPEVGGGKGDLHAINGLSNACEDYLLDGKGSVLDYSHCKDSPLEKSCSERFSQGFTQSDTGAVGISDLSMVTYSVPKCQGNVQDRETTFDLHGTSRSKCDFGRPADKLHSTSILLENDIYINKNENYVIYASDSTSGRTPRTSASVQDTMVSEGGQGVNKEGLSGQDSFKKASVDTSEIGNCSARKRLRKPPKRYIEEFPNQKSTCVGGKRKFSSTTSGNAPIGVRSQNEHQHVTIGVLTLASSKESACGANNQAPFGFQLQNGCPKKSASTLEFSFDKDSSASESEADHALTKRSVGGGDRRKNQRLWTPSEVMKLVDGVSQYGVGRWTDIKRLLFSSSAYRTPIDLRDKWRNLIKTSRAQLQDKREVEKKRNMLPKSLLQRVSELAAAHPYPRDRMSKPSRVSHVTEFNPGSRTSKPSHVSHVTESNPDRRTSKPLRVSHVTEFKPDGRTFKPSRVSHVTEFNPSGRTSKPSRVSHDTEFNPGDRRLLKPPHLKRDTEFNPGIGGRISMPPTVSNAAELNPGGRISVKLY